MSSAVLLFSTNFCLSWLYNTTNRFAIMSRIDPIQTSMEGLLFEVLFEDL